MNLKIILMSIAMSVFLSCQSREKIKAQELERGKEVYLRHCMRCHQQNGEGIPGIYPSLKKPAIIIDAQTHKVVRLIKYGGKFEGKKDPAPLTSREISDLVNYIQNSWGNCAKPVSQSQVEAIIINKPW